MRKLIVALVLSLAVAGAGVALTTGIVDPVTAYCNKKRLSYDTAMVTKMCNCSKKSVLYRSLGKVFDVGLCVGSDPQTAPANAVIPIFHAKLAALYNLVTAKFVGAVCPGVGSYESNSVSAASSTVAACCQSLSVLQTCLAPAIH